MTTYDWGKFGFHIPEIMLPREGTDYGKWAVVACDQYTSEPEYWEDAERIVGDALLVALEDDPEVVRVVLALDNLARHVVVKPHDDLVEADPVAHLVATVIHVALQVVGAPSDELRLEVVDPRLDPLVRGGYVYLLGERYHLGLLRGATAMSSFGPPRVRMRPTW